MNERRYLVMQYPDADPLDCKSWIRVFEVRDGDDDIVIYALDPATNTWNMDESFYSLHFLQIQWSDWKQTFITEEQFKEFIGRIFPDIL